MEDYPAYNSNNLKDYFNNEEFVMKTILQIQKNLNQFGYQFDLEEQQENLLELMIEKLRPVIADFMNHHQEKFMSYLYQVDLNEKSLDSQEFGDDFLDNICFKIIKREAQKIYFQFLLSNKKI